MTDVAVAAAVRLISKSRRVIVLSGAGMSTAAGIPDFRSPGGLYGVTATLLDKFTYLEGGARPPKWQRAALEEDIRNALTYSLFSINPLPYHEMRRGMIIGLGEGQWKLTIAHVFPEILSRHGKLELLASQNIDGLDHKVVSDKRKLYNPHGLMSTLVSEPIDLKLCSSPDDPIYQRYVELVKRNIRDIYADRPARQGKSSHLWPGPDQSTPITLEMFADLLPALEPRARALFEASAAQEKQRGTFSVKPGSVLFDRTLWTENAAGEPCSAFEAVEHADLVLVMGTSLSGLTIDNVAHAAGCPRLVLDLGEAPVHALRGRGSWRPGTDVHLQAPLDRSVLLMLAALGWLHEMREFLPHLCLQSLRTLHAFVGECRAAREAERAAAAASSHQGEAGEGAHMEAGMEAGMEADMDAAIAEAIALEVARESKFYGDE